MVSCRDERVALLHERHERHERRERRRWLSAEFEVLLLRGSQPAIGCVCSASPGSDCRPLLPHMRGTQQIEHTTDRWEESSKLQMWVSGIPQILKHNP